MKMKNLEFTHEALESRATSRKAVAPRESSLINIFTLWKFSFHATRILQVRLADCVNEEQSDEFC
jgi:hypothetical protein